jgi:hypothetical protein
MKGPDQQLATRAFATVQGTVGLLLLTRPDDVVATLAPRPDRPPRWLVRLLGARLVVQEAVIVVVPTRRVLLLGAATDTLHALSMVAAAFLWPGLRRAASVSAMGAAVSAALELVAARAADHT